MSTPANNDEVLKQQAVMHWNNLKTNASFRWFVETFLKEQAEIAGKTIIGGTAENFNVNRAKLQAIEAIQRDCKTRIN